MTDRPRGAIEESYDLGRPQPASTSCHELTGKLHAVREEERQRLARELHDELGQALTAIKLQITGASGKLPASASAVGPMLDSASAMVDSAIRAVRRIATELRPAALELGLIPALEWLGEEFQVRTGIRCELHLPPREVALDEHKLTVVFRIVQEALTNVARHSGATTTEVTLSEQPKGLILEVRDNGKGMLVDHVNARSLGLRGMRERALLVGSELGIQSGPGQGTVVSVCIPRRKRTGLYC